MEEFDEEKENELYSYRTKVDDLRCISRELKSYCRMPVITYKDITDSINGLYDILEYIEKITFDKERCKYIEEFNSNFFEKLPSDFYINLDKTLKEIYNTLSIIEERKKKEAEEKARKEKEDELPF